MAMLHEVEVKFQLHPDARSLNEEWSGVTDPGCRRKLQNRLNQRALRRRKLAEKPYQQRCSIACKGHGSEAINVEYNEFRDQVIKHHRILLAKHSLFANFGQVIREYNEHNMAYRLPADHLLSLIYYNVFRAFTLNIQRLGLNFDAMCCDEYQSKFPSMPPDDPSLTFLPPGLQPTQLQRSMPHHPMWDIFPDPVLRDNVLKYGEENFDDAELCRDIFGDGSHVSGEDTSNRTGLIAWGPDPGLTCAWEVTERLAKNWPWFLRNAKALEASTNAHRRMRGEEPIIFEAA